jgi:hypothetical protein
MKNSVSLGTEKCSLAENCRRFGGTAAAPGKGSFPGLHGGRQDSLAMVVTSIREGNPEYKPWSCKVGGFATGWWPAQVKKNYS